MSSSRALWNRPPFPTMLGIALLALAVIAPGAWAQGAARQAADAQLNFVYQRILPALSDSDRAKLRAAEREWVAFHEKFAAAASRLGRSSSELDAILADGLTARAGQLQRLAGGNYDGDSWSQRAAAADASLNSVYRQCLGQLGDADKERLRESQRAWIKFRDADIRVRPGLALSQTAVLTEHRTQQLRMVYLGGGGGGRNVPPEEVASGDSSGSNDLPKGSKVPDPFERAR